MHKRAYKPKNGQTYKPENNTSGFSLIEVLIAMALFSIGILAVASMQLTGIRINNLSDQMGQANSLSIAKIKKIKKANYLSPILADTNVITTGDMGLSNNTVDTADHFQQIEPFTVLWNIAEDVPANNSKTINVIVTWNDGRNPRQVQHATVKQRLSFVD